MKSITILVLLFLVQITFQGYTAAPYAQWAHEHVIWLNSKQQNQEKMYDLLNTYLSYDIPVGGVNIDSVWSTCINTFIVDRKKFPHMEQLVKDFHNKGVKVILWATSVINQVCPQYAQGKKLGYFLNNGKTIKWWHGRGAFIDFFNPKAKAWFQKLMDRVLDMGFDGWKCDGTDPMIYLLKPWPYSPSLKKYIDWPQYANQYYGTFYNYTKTRNPNALIMARPVDSFKGQSFVKYAPKNVMFAGWVGDQTHSIQGFKQALANIIHSATQGYLNFGFDIGGYKVKTNTFLKWLFLREVQLGSLLPFMQNGGNGNHQPWLYDMQTVDIYRKFAKLHHSLKSFLLTAGTQAYHKKTAVLQPLVPLKMRVQFQLETNMGYVIWNTFLVEPVLYQSGYVQVIFPQKFFWIYYFNRNLIYRGGITKAMGIKLDEAPLFIRSNSIFPIDNNELWLVYLKDTNVSRTFLRGKLSDDCVLSYNGDKLQVLVNRFYKNEQESVNQDKITLRLIGVQTKSLDQQFTQIADYQNEILVQIALNTKFQMKVKFINLENTLTNDEQKVLVK